MTDDRPSRLNVAIAERMGRRHSTAVVDASPARPGSELPVVLVVDDEPEITRSLAQLLAGDFRVLTASSAGEALDLLEANSVAVILTDQRMPGGTGAELLARTVAISPETTRVLFTGYSDITAVIDAVNEGQVYRYVTKPWRPEELRSILTQGLERYWLVRDNRRLMAELKQANADLEARVQERTRQLRAQVKALGIARRSIEELSRKDPLTGLSNRRRLDEVLLEEVARVRRHGAPLSVVMADLDHFKAINDAFGHAAGDQVLVAAAQAILAEARMTDVVGRYGGEEFLVVLPNTSLEGGRIIAERMRTGLRRLRVPDRPEPITASFGVAEWVADDSEADLVARADEAQYHAKRTGRDRVAVGRPARGGIDE